VRGRTFTAAESASADPDTRTRPIIVTETTARNLWGDADPIGRTLLRDDGDRPDITMHVVGVAADAQLSALGTINPYLVIEPRRPGGVLMVRSRADFGTTAANLRAIVRERDPSLAFRVLPLAANVEWWRGVSGAITSVGAGLGGLALVLAAVGIYGVVSFAVSRRLREIGIRMALGASAGVVLGTVLRQAMRPAVVGALIGVVAAIGVSRILSSVLFGVSPADALGLGGAALLVVVVALAAGLIAARPVTRVDPTITLRYE